MLTASFMVVPFLAESLDFAYHKLLFNDTTLSAYHMMVVIISAITPFFSLFEEVG
jgi:hypothetical protein